MAMPMLKAIRREVEGTEEEARMREEGEKIPRTKADEEVEEHEEESEKGERIEHKEEKKEEKGGRVEEEEDDKGGGREHETKNEWKLAYQNVGRGIKTTNILLARGREEEWDFVFVAEVWEGKNGERTTQ